MDLAKFVEESSIGAMYRELPVVSRRLNKMFQLYNNTRDIQIFDRRAFHLRSTGTNVSGTTYKESE